MEEVDVSSKMTYTVVLEDYFTSPETTSKQNLIITSAPAKVINLVCLEKELYWKGCLQSLKKIVEDELNIAGKLSSPGGDVKLFTSKDHAIKWYGPSKKKRMTVHSQKYATCASSNKTFWCQQI